MVEPRNLSKQQAPVDRLREGEEGDIESRLRGLVETNLATNQVSAEGAVRQLLQLASQVGGVKCTVPDRQTLCFVASNFPPCKVTVDGAIAKLRMLCARLAVLCQGNRTPYGGQGILAFGESPESPAIFRVSFVNTQARQEFAIEKGAERDPAMGVTSE